MLEIYRCIFELHDFKLVLLAALICQLATYTTFLLISRAVHAATDGFSTWIATSALALGCGVWATHFIAMLAYHPHVHLSYAWDRTALSILIAIFGSGAGLTLAMRRTRSALLLGGAIVGASIGAMHYTGMSAVSLAGHLRYDSAWVAISFVLGIGLGSLAIWLYFSPHFSKPKFNYGIAAAATLLTLGICGLHFAGMTATHIVADNTVMLSPQVVEPGLLAIAITSATILILALSLGGSLVDQHLATRNVQEAIRLRTSEARFRQLANAAFEGVLIHIDGRIVDANATLCRLIGRPLADVVGHSLLDFISESFQHDVRTRLNNPNSLALELEIIGRDAAPIPMEALAQSIDYNGVPARVVALRDLRERKKTEQHIHHMAHHDALTNLPNRTLFNDRLQQTLALAQRSGNRVAVLYLDLDRFKNVNDLLGHRGGDELLKVIAERLRNCLRAHDTVARLSGDEFAIIYGDAQQPDAVALLAERIINAVEQPCVLNTQQVLIGTSIGIALYPHDGDTADALLRSADTALYRAKECGRNRYRFFEAEMDLRLQERSRLEHDLRHALAANEQLDVYYQPLHDCESSEIVGFEALLRWQHPEHGFVSPVEFIPIAEDSGLIVALGEWVLSTACRDAAQWPDHLRIAINLSPIQFRQPDLAADILNILAKTGLPAHRLELEITESVLIGDTDRTLATLTALKAAGAYISLDDFGTGYSSLSYLQRFPFDKLKIDSSFVWDMENNGDSMAIVRAIIALGHSLRIAVTAEGVETEAQFAVLREENCDQIQGFLLGKPQPLHQIKKLLLQQTPPLRVAL